MQTTVPFTVCFITAEINPAAQDPKKHSFEKFLQQKANWKVQRHTQCPEQLQQAATSDVPLSNMYYGGVDYVRVTFRPFFNLT